mgnify:CR=1 FL=1
MTRDYAPTRPVRRRHLPAWAIVTAFVVAFLIGMCSPLWDAMPWASGLNVAPRPAPTAPHHRAAPAPLCVTTLWRARHTHRPLTRPGQVCRIDDGMWLPDSWLILGVVLVNGQPYLLVKRPAVKR